MNNKRSVVKTSDKDIADNLKLWFNSASHKNQIEGLEWYSEAQKHCKLKAKQYGMSTYSYAEIVSITSVNNKWERNKIDAESCVKAYQSGLKPRDIKICTYNANKEKAFRVLDKTQILGITSPKTHAFASNVGLNSPHHITIDKHHLRACVTKPSEGVVPDVVTSCTAKQYRRIEAITAQLASEQGLKGYQYQAIIWLAIKENWNR